MAEVRFREGDIVFIDKYWRVAEVRHDATRLDGPFEDAACTRRYYAPGPQLYMQAKRIGVLLLEAIAHQRPDAPPFVSADHATRIVGISLDPDRVEESILPAAVALATAIDTQSVTGCYPLPVPKKAIGGVAYHAPTNLCVTVVREFGPDQWRADIGLL